MTAKTGRRAKSGATKAKKGKSDAGGGRVTPKGTRPPAKHSPAWSTAEQGDSPRPPQAGTDEIPPEWRRWAAVSLMGGTSATEVIGTLVDEGGVAEMAAARYCGALLGDPVYEAGLWAHEQLDKLESMLSIRQDLRDLAPEELDRCSGLSAEEFLRRYYARNRPVILTDVSTDWPALTRWTPDYLLEVLGEAEVEVQGDRDADPEYEMNVDEHRRTMPFSEYHRRVVSSEGNDTYMVANNELLAGEAAKPLWDDFTADPRYLGPDPDHNLAYLWFGPRGTITPFHHDSMNVLFNQIAGRKRFTLVSSLDSHCMYNHVSVYSRLPGPDPDLEEFPLWARVRPYRFEVGPGDSVFVPVGWWHHVESLSTSMSLSFTNFRYPNSYEWAEPETVI